MPFYVPVGPRSILFQFGMIWTDVMGSLSYWWTNRRRPVILVPQSLHQAMPVGRTLDDSPIRRVLHPESLMELPDH
jgi:hypothetical protein